MERIAEPAGLSKIESLSGYAGKVMEKTKLAKINMAYIDGAHFYDAVKHDFYAFLKVASENFCILFS